MINSKKAVVIGAGFGGLAIAIRLRALGFQTEIYEKNEKVGGHAYQLKKAGYTFDMGPSLITLPQLFKELFKLNNENYENYLDLIYLDPFYRIYFHNKTYIDYSGDVESMKSQIRNFNKKDATNYEKFMSFSKNIYNAVIVEELGAQPFITIKDFIRFIPKAIKLGAILPAYHIVKYFFKDFRTRFVFSFHPLFIGGNPFKTPAIFLMLSYLEKTGGVWFTKGGMYTVILALVDLFKRMGGKINTSSEVSKIVIENGIAKGVIVNNKIVLADLVVSNAHFANTYMDLINETARKKWSNSKIKDMHYSMSSFILFLGINRKYEKLLHHTLIISPRYKELISDIFDKHILPKDFSLYLHVPTKSDPSMAPEGCESIYVLAPVTNLIGEIDWNTEGPVYAQKLLEFLENEFDLTDLSKHIEVKEIFTPMDFKENRNNYLGACWSLQPNIRQIANFRPHNRSEDIKNLYLVGASTHPGGGVPGVILGAKATEKVIKNDFGIK
jgi:phytoene desaturase